MAPGRPIFFTHLDVVPVSLNNKLHVNPIETFRQIDEKLTFGLSLAQFGAKKYGPGRPRFFRHFNIVPVSSNNKFHVNSKEIFSQTDKKN